MKKILLFILLWILFLSWCSNLSNDNYINNKKTINEINTIEEKNEVKSNDKKINKDSNYITIKYRDTLVDVSNFETFNTSKSSFIEKAYYDKSNQYLILNLSWTYYHWCEVPEYIRKEFKKSDSLWKYYNKYIKWDNDCRLWYIPQYN